MLTFFSTAKPFNGHSRIIQRNALKSWTLVHPDSEVILFGDEDGAAETCHELGIRHQPLVQRNQNGTKYLNYIFDRASEISRHDILCYANCDIMFTSDFIAALQLASKVHDRFLMIGRRRDTIITEPWDFNQPKWCEQLRSFALRTGKLNGPTWVDYFCFSRDLYRGKMPAFLVGRNGWDPWLVWFARNNHVPLVDASRDVVAVHQNHDYAYLKQGTAALRADEEARYNWNLGKAPEWHFYATDAATERLVSGQLVQNPLAFLGPPRRRLVRILYWLWFLVLKITKPIRHPLGLRRTG